MDVVEELKNLKSKKELAQEYLTRYKTQLEGAVEKRDEYIADLQEKFGITPDELDGYIEKLREKRDCLLQEAKTKLDKIDLQ